MTLDDARAWLVAPVPEGLIDPDPEVTADAIRVVLKRLAELEAETTRLHKIEAGVNGFLYLLDQTHDSDRWTTAVVRDNLREQLGWTGAS